MQLNGLLNCSILSSLTICIKIAKGESLSYDPPQLLVLLCSGFSWYFSISVLRALSPAIWVPTSIFLCVECLQFKEPRHYNLDPSCIQTLSMRVSNPVSCVCSALEQSVHRNLLVCAIYASCHCPRHLCAI